MMLEQHVEALIFASEKPVTKKEIKDALRAAFGWEVNDETFEQALQALRDKFGADTFSFQIVNTGGGYEFVTKKEHAPLINAFLNQKAKKRLTRAALETLSIIAYKQPITRTEIEQIRGVNCDYTIQKLLEKELIVIAGRADGPGHPLTYATSEQFMDYFGINSPADLPKLREIEAAHENEIGEAPAIETEPEPKAGPEIEIVNPFDPRLQESNGISAQHEPSEAVNS
ncbi:MAG TPA: SMC-Scp complex subunit ScpB [Chitinophagales bacterium]|nr:SMC-Scp complex subunit ScpB [Chitinophagales bacterium]